MPGASVMNMSNHHTEKCAALNLKWKKQKLKCPYARYLKHPKRIKGYLVQFLGRLLNLSKSQMLLRIFLECITTCRSYSTGNYGLVAFCK